MTATSGVSGAPSRTWKDRIRWMDVLASVSTICSIFAHRPRAGHRPAGSALLAAPYHVGDQGDPAPLATSSCQGTYHFAVFGFHVRVLPDQLRQGPSCKARVSIFHGYTTPQGTLMRSLSEASAQSSESWCIGRNCNRSCFHLSTGVRFNYMLRLFFMNPFLLGRPLLSAATSA